MFCFFQCVHKIIASEAIFFGTRKFLILIPMYHLVGLLCCCYLRYYSIIVRRHFDIVPAPVALNRANGQSEEVAWEQ